MRDPVSNEYIPAAWETVPCPACGSERRKPYEKFGHQRQYSYVRCQGCGLFYSSPRPRYDEDFVNCCYADYEQFVADATTDDLRAIRTSSLTMFEQEVAHLLKFDDQRSAVLDIGSAMGTFLLAAKPHYRKLTGLDVSEKMAEFVRRDIGVEVRIEQFHQHQPEQPYSLIHMSHVIEHVPNPNQWLQHARKLLTPGGILVVNVPNKLSYSNVLKHVLWRLRLKKHLAKFWADPRRTPDHLFEPTLGSFRRLFARHGYEILDLYTYSRRDPASTGNATTRLLHRRLKWGNNLGFILTPLDAAATSPVSEYGRADVCSTTSGEPYQGMVTYDLPAAGVMGQFPIQRVSADNLPLCEALSTVSYSGTTGHQPIGSRAKP